MRHPAAAEALRAVVVGLTEGRAQRPRRGRLDAEPPGAVGVDLAGLPRRGGAPWNATHPGHRAGNGRRPADQPDIAGLVHRAGLAPGSGAGLGGLGLDHQTHRVGGGEGRVQGVGVHQGEHRAAGHRALGAGGGRGAIGLDRRDGVDRPLDDQLEAQPPVLVGRRTAHPRALEHQPGEGRVVRVPVVEQRGGEGHGRPRRGRSEGAVGQLDAHDPLPRGAERVERPGPRVAPDVRLHHVELGHRPGIAREPGEPGELPARDRAVEVPVQRVGEPREPVRRAALVTGGRDPIAEHAPRRGAEAGGPIVDQPVAVVVLTVAELGDPLARLGIAGEPPFAVTGEHPVGGAGPLPDDAGVALLGEGLVDLSVAVVVEVVADLAGRLDRCGGAGDSVPGLVADVDARGGALARLVDAGRAQGEVLVGLSVAVVVELVAGLVARLALLRVADGAVACLVAGRLAHRGARAHPGLARLAQPEAFVDLLVAVVVDAVAELRLPVARRRVAGGAVARLVADPRALALARPHPDDAGVAQVVERLVGLPVAVVVQPVADLSRRLDVLHAAERPARAGERPRPAQALELGLAGGPALGVLLVGVPVAVVVLAVAGLGLRGRDRDAAELAAAAHHPPLGARPELLGVAAPLVRGVLVRLPVAVLVEAVAVVGQLGALDLLADDAPPVTGGEPEGAHAVLAGVAVLPPARLSLVDAPVAVVVLTVAGLGLRDAPRLAHVGLGVGGQVHVDRARHERRRVARRRAPPQREGAQYCEGLAHQNFQVRVPPPGAGARLTGGASSCRTKTMTAPPATAAAPSP